MAKIPQITLGISDDNKPVVFIDSEQATSMADLLSLAPELDKAEALLLAQIANHFAYDVQYIVIEDPKIFADKYMAQVKKEDSNVGWREGVIRLIDFGIPDFNEIKTPEYSDNKLVFYAVDAFLGVPYKVEVSDLKAAPTYNPLPLTPLA